MEKRQGSMKDLITAVKQCAELAGKEAPWRNRMLQSLVCGFPWPGYLIEDQELYTEICHSAGLLELVPTTTYAEQYEYGETMYQLTKAGENLINKPMHEVAALDSADNLPWPALVTALEVLRDIHEHGKPVTRENFAGRLAELTDYYNPECVRAFERLNELFIGEKE
jgi:hypothetical protein